MRNWSALALASVIFFGEGHKPLCVAQHSHSYHDVGILNSGSRRKYLENSFEMLLIPKPYTKQERFQVFCVL